MKVAFQVKLVVEVDYDDWSAEDVQGIIEDIIKSNGNLTLLGIDAQKKKVRK